MNQRALVRYLATGEYIPTEDAAPTSLEAHDRRFHPNGFDPKKDHCGLRESMAKGDEIDKYLSVAGAEGNGGDKTPSAAPTGEEGGEKFDFAETFKDNESLKQTLFDKKVFHPKEKVDFDVQTYIDGGSPTGEDDMAVEETVSVDAETLADFFSDNIEKFDEKFGKGGRKITPSELREEIVVEYEADQEDDLKETAVSQFVERETRRPSSPYMARRFRDDYD